MQQIVEASVSQLWLFINLAKKREKPGAYAAGLFP
jgi:hypothetical protein